MPSRVSLLYYMNSSCTLDDEHENMTCESVFTKHSADCETAKDRLAHANEGLMFEISRDVKRGEELLMKYPIVRSPEEDGGGVLLGKRTTSGEGAVDGGEGRRSVPASTAVAVVATEVVFTRYYACMLNVLEAELLHTCIYLWAVFACLATTDSMRRRYKNVDDEPRACTRQIL